MYSYHVVCTHDACTKPSRLSTIAVSLKHIIFNTSLPANDLELSVGLLVSLSHFYQEARLVLVMFRCTHVPDQLQRKISQWMKATLRMITLVFRPVTKPVSTLSDLLHHDCKKLNSTRIAAKSSWSY